MTVALADQYFVELDRNVKFQAISVLISIFLPVIHGLIFFWVPWVLRGKRLPDSLTHPRYFTLTKYFDSLNRSFGFSVLGSWFFFQPSLILMAIFHLGVNGWLCYAQTKDLTYEPQYYIISKRIGRICIGHAPVIFLMVTKNNLVSGLSGLSLDKSVFFHKWYGRSMFLAALIHMLLSLQYWLGLDFEIMVEIPPQIFGFIAFSCLGLLNLGSFKFIRSFAFEVFLAQHRVFNFIMLLLAYFHNSGNHAAVLIGIHMLVIDRVVGRVIGICNKRYGPTKGVCDFEIMDELTVRVTIPVPTKSRLRDKWYWVLVPRYGDWRAGQNVLFNCNKVALLAYHPFTISSLPDSGAMVLVIKVHKGFTKQLHKRIMKLEMKDEEENADFEATELLIMSQESADSKTQLKKEEEAMETVTSKSVAEFVDLISNFTKPKIHTLKAGMNGPFGANYQPLVTFDTVMFFSAGSGASFTLPVAIDLLRTLEERDLKGDFLNRPAQSRVIIVLSMRNYANLQWYDHMWPHLVPFLESGRAQLALHITREADVRGVGIDDQDASSKLENAKDKIEEIHFSLSSAEETTFEKMPEKSFTLVHGRPDFDRLIRAEITDLCSPNYKKSIACVGCGASQFNKEIQRVCETAKWCKNAPDVYYYNEFFDA